MLYTEWMANNAAMDTPSIKMSRKRYFWYLTEMGGLVMNWTPRLYLINLTYVILLFINHSYFVVCLFVSMMKAQGLTAMCGFLNILALVLIAMITVVIAHVKRRAWFEFQAMSYSGFYNYCGNLLGEDQIVKWNKASQFLTKVFFSISIPWLALIAVSIVSGDLVDGIFGYEKTNETIINGIYQTVPWKMWFYHSLDNDIIRWLTILSQVACSGGLALVIGCADLIMFFGGQHLIIQLKILNMAVRDTDERAAKLYETEVGRKPPSDPIDKNKDPELMGFYEFCLKQTVEHHQVILRYASIYHELINWPCGLVVVNGSIVVAMSMLGIMQGGGQPSVLVTSFLLIIAEVASIFMVCEVGETITNLCEELFDSMYSFNWMDCSVEVKKVINIMKSCMKKPIILTAGSLTPIDRNTFGTMMNTAYSYMNLVLASGTTDEK